MELRHLRYFIAVAEELHFGRAARRLQMAQQPLSRQISHLETEINVQLFYRTKRTVRLTEAGQIFLVEAKKTLQQAELAVLTAQRISRGEAGRFTVGYTGPALNSVLPQTVRLFKQRYLNVEIVLERLQTNEQVNALIAGQIQAGLLHPPINNNTLIVKSIHQESLVAALPDTHAIASTKTPISVKELAQEPFILYPRHIGPVLYDRIIAFCQQAGFSPNVVQEAIPQQTILGLVAADIGVALLHASAQAIAPPGVIFRPLIEPTPQLELAVAWHPDTTNPVLPSFLAIVQEIASVMNSSTVIRPPK